MAAPIIPPTHAAAVDVHRALPMAELAMARLAALTPRLRGCSLFTDTGEVIASRGEPLVCEVAGEEFWAPRNGSSASQALTAHTPIPGGELFAVRVSGLAMLMLTDPGTLPSLTLLDMQTILSDLGHVEVASANGGSR